MDVRALPPLLAAGAVALAAPSAVSPAPREGWRSGGPFGGTVSALELDPSRPSVAYAGTFGAGVFKTADGGRTWRRSSSGLPPDAFVLALETAPSRPSTLYAETYGTRWLYRSVDGARSWRALAPDDAAISDLAVDPVRSDTVYLAAFEGLLRTSDGGASWNHLSGLQHPTKVAVAPSARNVLYAEDGGAIMRSGDGGASWAQRSISEEANYDVFTVDPRDPDTLYVSKHDALLRSTDGGARWAVLRKGSFALHVYVLAFDRSDPRRLYAGTDGGGVFRSPDAGRTWSHVGRLPRERVRDLEAAGGHVLVGLEHRGAYRLSGRRWRPSSRGLAAAEVRALAVDPRAPRVVYGGTAYGGVVRSVDAGRHWSPRGLAGTLVFSLAVDPAAHRVVYAGISGGLYRSADGGRSWRRARGIPRNDVRSVVVAPSAHRVVYACTFDGGTYGSRDGGSTWRRLGLPNQVVTALGVDPKRATTVWAGTRAQGILRSTDGGKTWKLGTGIPQYSDPFAILAVPSAPRVVYAADDDGGLFKSTDGGRSWRRSVTGSVTSILGLALDRRRPGTLYAGGYDPRGRGGVFRSTDAGRTWTDISAGMTTTWVAALALDPAGHRLYAGTTAYTRELGGGGVFARRVP
jgi:photosystem II stability/assembly factor-like uncharacterized protein